MSFENKAFMLLRLLFTKRLLLIWPSDFNCRGHVRQRWAFQDVLGMYFNLAQLGCSVPIDIL